MSLAYVDGKYVEIESPNTYEYIESMEDLQKELDSTDYKIIKATEYELVGLASPYDMQALHIERQALRDKINELKEKENGN